MIQSDYKVPNPTPRLLLRLWQETDKPPFRQMNADQRVMEYFLAPLSNIENEVLFNRINAHHKAHGFGFWAVELRATGAFIGCVGLAIPSWNAPFMPCIEIGWRLARAYWHQGYATEAAQAALAFGFNIRQLDEMVSFTAASHDRSQRVMQRLGMQTSVQDDFFHTALPQAHPLAKHVLYRLARATWKKFGKFG